MSRPSPRTLGRAALTAGVVLLMSCRSAPPARSALESAPEVAPWEIPPSAMPGQKLFRLEAERGAEHGSLRLVLKLWSPRRFEVSTSDALGRPVWSLKVREGEGAWSTDAGRHWCRQPPDQPVTWPGLGLELPAGDLPAVLLGRLPEGPAETAGEWPAAGRRAFIDDAGRRWEVELVGGRVESWRLSGEAGSLTWSREREGGRLEARTAELLVRWREVARAPLAGTMPVWPVGLQQAPECTFDELP